MDFEFKIEPKEQYNFIHFGGDLIEANQTNDLLAQVDEHINESRINFIIDLHSIEYMNSTGLNILINILTKSRNAGGETVIANIPEKVKQLMIITKLNTVFTVADTVQEAIDLLKKEESWL
ncbi:MAG TPA: anti-sigma factor antagonist [Flavobacteriales bacterium]|nr:anti-sigma factor antagonist [Flavobacteriales bacterium]